jgi:hypothetical protein
MCVFLCVFGWVVAYVHVLCVRVWVGVYEWVFGCV